LYLIAVVSYRGAFENALMIFSQRVVKYSGVVQFMSKYKEKKRIMSVNVMFIVAR